jgi:hypothetical protein
MYREKDTGTIIAIVGIAIIAFTAIFGGRYIERVSGQKRTPANSIKPNMELHNLRAYVPVDWNQSGNYRMSPSGNCKILGATTNFSQETAERGLFDVELEHKDITLNGINMSYGYKETETEKYYSYFFSDDNYKYMIVFINNINSDDTCNKYLEQLERSITLEK